MARLLFIIPFSARAISVAIAAPRHSNGSPRLTETSVTSASPSGERETASPLIVKTEALLDRAHFSPGEIDGEDGDNYRSALRAFQQANNLRDSGKLDAETWTALTLSRSAEPVLKHYTISAEDVAGPFEKSITASLDEMAKLPGLTYTSPLAELAEKFHMSEGLLRKLNPRANFSQ